MTFENLNAFVFTYCLYKSGGLFSNTEFQLSMLHVKMRRLTYGSAHVTIFLTDNANVCCNSRARTKKCKKKQFFLIAHISLTILQIFLVFMMLVNIV